MPQRRAGLLLALTTLLLLATARPTAATAPVALAAVDRYRVAAETPELSAQPTTVSTCTDLETAERRLEREEPGVGWAGPRGLPQLCLLYYPAEDVYKAAILRVDSIEQFQAAKADAARRLVRAGFDLCRIATWEAWGRPGPRLQGDDRFDLPVECQPRVVAGDPGATEWLPYVREAVARTVDVVAREMDWRPNRLVTIIVLTDLEAAVSTYERYAGDASGQQAGYAAQAARDGRSPSVLQSTFGSLILLNVARDLERRQPIDAVRDRIAAALAHEYTHTAQHGIGGSGRVPQWFLEGQAVYQEYRTRGQAADDLILAARAQRDGTALGLPALARREDWYAREQARGRAAVYSRAYAAVLFLVERHGFAATVQLLRENHNGSYERFDELLAARTGMDLAALDRALGAWLTAPGRVLLRDDFSHPSSGWPRQSSDPSTRRVGYEGGEYYVDKLAGSGSAPSVWRPVPLSDFLAEVDARLMPPTDGGYLYLEFRRQQNGDRYSLVINPNNGTFRLQRRAGNDWTTLIGWTHAPVINGGAARNRLGVRAQGPEIVLLVNGQEVGRAHDEALREGGLGFGVGNVADGPTEGRFSNLVVANAN